MNPSGGGMLGFDIPQNPLMFMGEPQASESMWAHPIGGAFSPPVQQTEENNYYLGDPLGLTIALKEALKQALEDNTQDLKKLLKYTPYWTAYQDDELKKLLFNFIFSTPQNTLNNIGLSEIITLATAVELDFAGLIAEIGCSEDEEHFNNILELTPQVEKRYFKANAAF